MTLFRKMSSEVSASESLVWILETSDNTIAPYVTNVNMETDSEDSSAQTDSVKDGDIIKLYMSGFQEVGLGCVVEAQPKGEWRGVPIPLEPLVFVLLRPSSIVDEARHLSITPLQRGIQMLMDVLNETVLWRSADVVKCREDPNVDDSPYIRQEEWIGREVHRHDAIGLLLSSGRITCWRADDCYQNSTLGEDHVGVTVLDVFVGNIETIMTHARWPLAECWFPGGRCLKDIVNHFNAFPDAQDPLAYLGGREKAPYRFVVCQPSLSEKEIQFDRKTSNSEIQKVSSENCCKNHCCQLFPRDKSLKVRQVYFSKNFEERREYGIAVGGQLHSVEWTRKRKYITVEEVEVCATAWYIIHGIPKSTYHNYVEKYKEGVVSCTHGNKGIKRPRLRTVQVTGTMKAIIENSADQMPHQMRCIGNGRVDTLKFLPAGNNWKRVHADANELNVEYGLPPVSQATISRLKKEHFNNVAIKPVGGSFAKCTKCNELQQFILKSPKGSLDYVEFMKQRTEHLNHQASCRRLYASWREESKRNPQEILCIIHDKMDTRKTALPRMRVTTKATQGLGQLPMSVTGMVAHGHADGAYAHYGPACWPGDSNFTISSLARLVCRLEGPPIRETGDLFPFPPANAMFDVLLRGKSRCMDALKLILEEARQGSRPLPKKLYLQLDNSAKDNKNQYLMAFLSLLTARGVFKEIQVGFLLVGHIHEDIDAYFSHLSKSLKNKNTFVVADLMKSFMESQELSFMPKFIQEVGDFKSFVKEYLCSGTAKLIGLGEMHLFRFYVDSDGVPVMKYKKSAVDSQWLPSDAPPRCLWVRDRMGHSKLPRGCPKPVPLKPMWGSEVPEASGNHEKAVEAARKATLSKDLILLGIEKYIDFWQNGMAKCQGFAIAFAPYVEYWKCVLHELKEPLPECLLELVEGFWPQYDWRVDDSYHQGPAINPIDMTIVEEDKVEPFCGPANETPRESFNPWIDIRPGSWVLLRPEDPTVCVVWQGRALSDVCRQAGHENNGKFLIQYWKPDNSERNLELMYRNCWFGKWVVENRPPTWVDASCAVYANWSKKVNPKSRTIPKRSREAALANLSKANEVDP